MDTIEVDVIVLPTAPIGVTIDDTVIMIDATALIGETIQVDVIAEQGLTGVGVPTGGTTGQYLVKNSATNYDASWVTAGGGPPTGSAGGDLAGSTYPNPVIATDKITTAKILNANVTRAKIAADAWLAPIPTGADVTKVLTVNAGPTLAWVAPSGGGGGDATSINGAVVGSTTPLARGDILVANTTPALVRLARGATNTVLTATATDAVWQSISQAMLPTAPSGILTTNINDLAITSQKVTPSAIRGTPSAGGTAREIAKLSIWAADDVIDLSISTAKLAALAVTDAKINDMVATKLTGTIAQARFPTAPSGLLTTNINDSQVTNAKCANMAAHTFKGNNTASPAAPLDLTQAELTADLNLFSTSTTVKGLVPGSNGVATTNFLRADGTWAVPSGGTASNSFSTIAPSSGSSPVATSPTDTLIMTGTLPVVVTGTAGTDTLVFSLSTAGITNSLLANMNAHTFKGNNTAGAGVPLDLTIAQLTAELNTFTATLKGLVPFPPGGATTTDFLRADGTWAVPSGGGGSDATSINGASVGTTTPLARGDLLIANATPALARVAKGTTGQVLSATATDAVWQSLAQSQFPAAPSGLLTTNINDSQITRVKTATDLWLSPIPVGGDVGKVLVVTAGPALSWATSVPNFDVTTALTAGNATVTTSDAITFGGGAGTVKGHLIGSSTTARAELTVNVRDTGVQDDVTKASWRIRLGATEDNIQFNRHPAGGAAATLATLSSTGKLTVSADPTAALDVATKQYVDAVSVNMSANITPTGTRPTTSFTVPQLSGANPTAILAVLNGLVLDQVGSPTANDEFSLSGTALTTFLSITSTDKFKVFLWY